MYIDKCPTLKIPPVSSHGHPPESVDESSLFNAQRQSCLVMYNTKRVTRLGISKVYINHDGNCRGAVRYFLENFANAYQNIEDKSNLKDRFIYGLRLEKGYIADQQVLSKIVEYQNNGKWNQTTLTFIQSLHNNVKNLSEIIIDMIDLMELNNLNDLYNEVFTYEHATAIIIFRESDNFKIVYYDPSSGIYSKVILNPGQVNLNSVNGVIPCMDYFAANPELYVYVKCYSINPIITNNKDLPPLSSLPQSLKCQQQMLVLAIDMNDYNLVKNILDLVKLDLKFRCNRVTPISVATANQNLDIIKLLVEYDRKIVNFIDQKGYSPLGIAVFKQDVSIAKLLLELGALVDFPKGYYCPTRIAERNGCVEIDQLLKSYESQEGCIIF